MNILSFTMLSLRGRKTSTVFTILAIAVAVALTCTVLLLSTSVEKGIKKQSETYDLVVGSEGSPLQLVLNSLMYLDAPTGNIPYHIYEDLQKDERVLKAIPLALGDSYKGSPIVGTTQDFFEPFREGLKERFTLQEGEWFNHSAEVIIGHQVARDSSLSIGDEFHGNHGAVEGANAHADFTYKVVGVLDKTGTADDRAIFTPIESVWAVHEYSEEEATTNEDSEHEEDKQITTLLLKPEQLGFAPMIKEELDTLQNIQAVYPVMVLRQLLETFSSGKNIAFLLVGVSIIMAGLFIVFAVLSSVNQRKKETQILRALGVQKRKILVNLMLENVLISSVGTVIGVVLTVITFLIVRGYSLQLVGIQLSNELLTLAFAVNGMKLFLIAFLISAIATIWAYSKANQVRVVKGEVQ